MTLTRVWMRCQRCRQYQQLFPQQARCRVRTGSDPCLPCGGIVTRCDPPTEPAPMSAAWLAARAMQHLIARE